MRQKKGEKPVDSKTVRQWALLGRIPVSGAIPSYIWDMGERPIRVYYHERDTREMLQEEQDAFMQDQKGYSKRFVDQFEDTWRELKDE